MKVLKTIVATAVIVLATSSVAVAGVQHLTRAQDAQAVKTRAQHTLTDRQQLQRSDDQSGSHVREAKRTKTQAHRAHREHAQAQQGGHKAEAQHVARVQNSSQGGSASQSGSHHYEASQQTHVSTGGHDSGHAGGHGGD
jgi:hypothetical protein